MTQKIFHIIFLFLAIFLLIDSVFPYPNALAVDITAAVKISVCGNDIKEGGEQCDGNDISGRSCAYLGYNSGAISCTASCGFDTSNCSTSAEATTTATFTPSVGGSQTLSDGEREASVSLPTGFYSDSLQMEAFSYLSAAVSDSKPEPSDKQFVGKVYDINFFDSSGNAVSTLSKPTTIILTYTDSDVSGIEESAIKPYKSEDGSSSWQLISGSILDTENNTVTFTATSFSWFALLGSVSVDDNASSNSNDSKTGGRRRLVNLPYIAYEDIVSNINNALSTLFFGEIFNEKDNKDKEKNSKQNSKSISPANTTSVSKTSTNKTQNGSSDNLENPSQNISDNGLKIIISLLIIIGAILVRFISFL